MLLWNIVNSAGWELGNYTETMKKHPGIVYLFRATVLVGLFDALVEYCELGADEVFLMKIWSVAAMIRKHSLTLALPRVDVVINTHTREVKQWLRITA